MARQTLSYGLTLSSPELSPEQIEKLKRRIVRALIAAHRGDVDVADLIAAACRETARKVGGSTELTVHRSGSWEAEYIRALAAGWELGY